MDRDVIIEKVTEIFRNNFDDDDIVLTDETTAADIEDWDSLEHVNLVVAMEKKFNLKFDMKAVGQLKNVGEMVDLIKEKLENWTIINMMR